MVLLFICGLLLVMLSCVVFPVCHYVLFGLFVPLGIVVHFLCSVGLGVVAYHLSVVVVVLDFH